MYVHYTIIVYLVYTRKTENKVSVSPASAHSDLELGHQHTDLVFVFHLVYPAVVRTDLKPATQNSVVSE